MTKSTQLATLFDSYAKARDKAKEAEKAQKELSAEIKEILGDTEEAESPEYICSYKYDKDQEVFDAIKFAKKEPKKFAAYQKLHEDMKQLTKKYFKTVKGARKLIITRKNEGEE